MPICSFQLGRTLLDELAIELSGTLDENTALLCEREVRTQLNLARNSSLRVLWDLRELGGYSLDARDVLVRLQCFLADKASRTVYVAERAEPRSLALWVVRMANHRDAHIAPNLDLARAWLRGREDDTEITARPLSALQEGRPSVRPLSSARTEVVIEPFDKIAG